MDDLPTFLKLEEASSLRDGGGGAPSTTEDRGSVADFKMTCQEALKWCWAAVAQAVEDWRGTIVSQVAVASKHINPDGDQSLCEDANGESAFPRCKSCTESCTGPHRLSEVLKERCLMALGPTKQPPSFETIRTAIKQQRPLPVRIQWNGTTDGHFVCITGYSEGRNGQWVTVHDPLFPGINKGRAEARDIRYNVFKDKYCVQLNSVGTPNFYYEVQHGSIS